MKKFILIIVLFFAVIVCQAQETPGKQLRKASNNYFTGLAVGFGDGLAGFYLYQEVDQKAGLAVIGISGVTAIIFQLSAWQSIGRAGKLMEENNKISFIPDRETLGFGVRMGLN